MTPHELDILNAAIQNRNDAPSSSHSTEVYEVIKKAVLDCSDYYNAGIDATMVETFMAQYTPTL